MEENSESKEKRLCNCKSALPAIIIKKISNGAAHNYYKCSRGNAEGCGMFEKIKESPEMQIEPVDVKTDSNKRQNLEEMEIPSDLSPEEREEFIQFLKEKEMEKTKKPKQDPDIKKSDTSSTTRKQNSGLVILNSKERKPTISPQPITTPVSSNPNNNNASSNESENKDNIAAQIKPPKCHCGSESVLRTTNKGDNKGKQFYACRRMMNDPNNCKYFMWKLEWIKQKTTPEKFPPVKRCVATNSKIYNGPGRFSFVDFNGQVSQEIPAYPPRKPRDPSTLSRSDYCIELFMSIAEIKHWKCRRAHGWEDEYSYKHVYIVQGPYDERSHWVRIEAAKSNHLYNGPVQYENIWIQLHGINTRNISTDEDDQGWLIGGEYDILAVEAKDHFVMFDRKKLWKYVDTHVEKEIVSNPEQAEYKHYKHPRNSPLGSDNELLTMVSVSKINEYNSSLPEQEKIIIAIWQFPDNLKQPFREKIEKFDKIQRALSDTTGNEIRNENKNKSGKEEEKEEI